MSEYCGSDRGYREHRKLGEDTCPSCREAHARYQRGGGVPRRGTGRSRALAVIPASLPPFCACGGERRMALVSVQGMRAAGHIRCPHCDPEPGQQSIEIRTYRMRVDTPRHEPNEVA